MLLRLSTLIEMRMKGTGSLLLCAHGTRTIRMCSFDLRSGEPFESDP